MKTAILILVEVLLSLTLILTNITPFQYLGAFGIFVAIFAVKFLLVDPINSQKKSKKTW